MVPPPGLAASASLPVRLGRFGLFVAWIGLSVLWSFGPDLSWVAFDLAAFYLAVAAFVALTPVRRLHLVIGYADFSRRRGRRCLRVPRQGAPGCRDARAHVRAACQPGRLLERPRAPDGAGADGRAGSRRGSARASGLAYPGRAAGVPLCFTFFFTLSRGGWVALAVILVVYFAFSTTRLSSLASLVAIVAPVAAVLWRLRDLGTLFTATPDDCAARPPGAHPAAVLARRPGHRGRRPVGPLLCRRRAVAAVRGWSPAPPCSWCSSAASAAAHGASSRRAAAPAGSGQGARLSSGTDRTQPARARSGWSR